MINRKTYCLSLIAFLPFISLANSEVNLPIKGKEIKFNVIDVAPDSVPASKRPKETKSDRAQDDDIIKSVPKSRRQAKPIEIKPHINGPKVIKIKPITPAVKPKINVPVKIKVKI